LSGAANVGTSLSVAQGATITGSTNITGATNIVGDTNITGVVTITNQTAQPSLNVVGNISVTGTVDSVDVSALRDAVIALQQKVSTLIPVGTIMSSSRTTPHTADGVWLVCDGTELNVADYQDLFDAIQYSFGGSGAKFNLPDLRRRTVVGKATADTLGANEGSAVDARLLTHKHTGAQHTHDLRNHTHSIPAHKHSITASSTLQIASSGTHNTSLRHTHGDFFSTSPLEVSSTNAATLTHKHTYSHSHGSAAAPLATMQTRTLDHTHTHSHAFPYTNIQRIYRGAYSDSTYYAFTSTSNYNLPTSGTGVDLTPSGANPTTHNHGFWIDSTQNTTDGVTAQDNSLAHRHKITITEFNESTSGGEHTHGPSTFSGSVGDDTALDGNSSLTSGTPSNNNTGSATFTADTGDTTTPHILLNFIIKAKNS
jgi:microcystin-dependent protein